jgi:hypothetical protein
MTAVILPTVNLPIDYKDEKGECLLCGVKNSILSRLLLPLCREAHCVSSRRKGRGAQVERLFG